MILEPGVCVQAVGGRCRQLMVIAFRVIYLLIVFNQTKH